ncbi:hypothetical protein M405DRAFT_819357 [Rhizopogon salebrosus TDB-379]|nr:hypothetical protein M405DRAFT_819357 [Rhizopogon salebrosus TDB-379]
MADNALDVAYTARLVHLSISHPSSCPFTTAYFASTRTSPTWSIPSQGFSKHEPFPSEPPHLQGS